MGEDCAVEFDKVSLAFDDHVVLKDLSFSVPKGSMRILLGAFVYVESRAAEVGSGTGAGPDKRADAPDGKRPGGAASNGEGEKGQR